MAIVKYKNQSGLIYAYESTSKWDPEKKQARPVRKYLGRVDPETGEIIPTAGKRGRPRKDSGDNAGDNNSPGRDVKELSAELARANEKIDALLEENSRLKGLLHSIYQISSEAELKPDGI